MAKIETVSLDEVSVNNIAPVEGLVISEKQYNNMGTNLEQFFDEFKDVVASGVHDLGKAIGVKLRIETRDNPVYTPAGRLAHALKPIVDKTISEMLETK